MNIKAKLTTIICGLLLVALGVLGGINYWQFHNLITGDAEAGLKLTAAGTANEAGLWFETRKAETVLLANSPLVLEDRDKAMAYLTEESRRNPIFSRFFLVDGQGNAVYTNKTRANVSDRDFYQKVMVSGQSFIADPVISKVDGQMVVVIAAPLKQAGKTVGMLGGTVMVNDLIEKVLTVKTGQTGYAYVIQGNGLVIIHPEKDLIMKANFLADQAVDAQLRQLTGQMTAGKQGAGRYTLQGVGKYLAYAPVTGTSWSLAVTVPAAEVLTGLDSFKTGFLITLGAVLLLAGMGSFFFARTLARPLQMLSAMTESISCGDLTVPAVTLHSKDELGRLAADFNTMTANTKTVVKQVMQSAEQVAAASEELTASAEQSAVAATHVAGAIGKVTVNTENQLKDLCDTTLVVEKLSRQIQEIAGGANEATHLARETSCKIVTGKEAVEQTVNQMNKIDQATNSVQQAIERLAASSSQINEIVNVIASIAGQTNLLALNAAIEAARAGEQGRGFAVVADEVRKLAEQTQEAAKQITGLIGENQANITNAVNLMNVGTGDVRQGIGLVHHAGDSFAEIARLVGQVSDQIRGISAAIGDMAVGSAQIVDKVRGVEQAGNQVNQLIQGVSADTQSQSATMQEISVASHTLALLAEELQKAVHVFKL
ncbi:methyl-accepting chemotaxis protein [Sporomusa sp. GT1]|uniref:methyl-accepting chemotaxis protein n=1 Tax=Sporomusa TaxID=2375 RepID=UPI001669C333|nr:methyl-accepting chemotaxis protein [Sporomusa sp. GT1]